MIKLTTALLIGISMSLSAGIAQASGVNSSNQYNNLFKQVFGAKDGPIRCYKCTDDGCVIMRCPEELGE